VHKLADAGASIRKWIVETPFPPDLIEDIKTS
jgi:phosphoenolpyruvate synthase/pyruvate phosphate dikinase